MTAVDVLARRTRLAFLDAAAAEEALPAVIGLLADVHGWSAARRAEELGRGRAFLVSMHDPVRLLGGRSGGQQWERAQAGSAGTSEGGATSAT